MLARALSRSTLLGAVKQMKPAAASTAGVVSPPQPLVAGAAPTQVTTLENGMRVATEATGAHTATIGVWLDSGSRYETPAESGVAHFIEHLLFKGTEGQSQAALELSTEQRGAHLNAFTSREQTAYFSKTLGGAADAKWAVKTLGNLVMRPTLTDAAIGRERGVVLREMEDVEATPDEVVFEELHSVAYEGHGLGQPILGPRENIERFTADDLRAFMARHYTSDRMVLVGAGAVRHEELVALAQANFGKLRPGSGAVESVAAEAPVRFISGELKVIDDQMTQAHVAIGFEGMGWTHPDYFSMVAIQQIVGEWNHSSGSGANVTSKLGANFGQAHLGVHSMQPFHSCYHDTGMFGAYYVADGGDVDTATWMYFDEMRRIGNGVSEEEVGRARNQIKAALLAGLDGTQATAEDIGRQMLAYGRRMPLAEAFTRIDQVTPESIGGVSDTYMHDVDPSVVALGAVKTMPDYEKLRGFTRGMH